MIMMMMIMMMMTMMSETFTHHMFGQFWGGSVVTNCTDAIVFASNYDEGHKQHNHDDNNDDGDNGDYIVFTSNHEEHHNDDDNGIMGPPGPPKLTHKYTAVYRSLCKMKKETNKGYFGGDFANLTNHLAGNFGACNSALVTNCTQFYCWPLITPKKRSNLGKASFQKHSCALPPPPTTVKTSAMRIVAKT